MHAKLATLCGSLLLIGLSVAPAQAHWGVGIHIGIPIFVPTYGYYRPYPYYYGPAPVYVQPAPVYVQPVPTYVQPAPAPAPAPAPRPAPSAPDSVQSTPQPVVRAQAQEDRQTEIAHNIEHLRNPDEQARVDAVTRLGKLKSERAIDPLAATLSGDSSVRVREAAAKALGMIGSPKALPALQRAAKSDGDRDVRHTAQFAVEIVDGNR
jgi:hypothetical protein